MDSENQYAWPCEVEGTNSVLFTEFRSEREEDATISLLSLEDGSMKKLVDGGSFPKFSHSGHLLFVRRESIFVVPFNPDNKKLPNS